MQYIATRCLAVLALSATSWANGDLWTVDDNGPADFATIAAAISAANSGDVILVSPGSYSDIPVVFPNHTKDLVIVADRRQGGSVTLTGHPAIEVSFLDAANHVTIRGFDALRTDSAVESILLERCSGTVWLEECTVSTSVAPQPVCVTPRASLVVDACSQVHVRACTLEGTDGYITSASPLLSCEASPAATVIDSAAALWDSSLTGGDGTPGMDFLPIHGGDGAAGMEFIGLAGPAFQVEGMLSGCTLLGGKGGDADSSTGGCAPGGSGGYALFIDGYDVANVGSSTTSGFPGLISPGCTTGGFPVPVQYGGFGGSYDFFNGDTPRTFDTPAVTDEGMLTQISLAGDPIESLQLYSGAPTSAFGYQPVVHAFPGVAPGVTWIAATTDNAGQYVQAFNAPGVSGCEALVLHLQTLFGQPGSFFMSPPSTVVVLDLP